MAYRSLFLAASLSVLLSACASVDLPDVDFMGESDFSEDIEELDRSFPGTDETPDLPSGVRTAEEWDESAREMRALYDSVDVPQLESALTTDEFDRQFENAKEAAKAYKDDDPS